MKGIALLLSLISLPDAALAHPGHGKPGILHSHPLGEFGDWMANGALLLLAAVFFGVVCWMLVRRFRKST